MMKVFGDFHIRRGLPHTFTNSEGKDHRYNFLINLLKEITRDKKDIYIFLGDITDTKNTIDGKILEDIYKILQDKKVLILVGNHDRSADKNKYTSLVEILDMTNKNIMAVDDIYETTIADTKLIFTSYYADDEDIKARVDNAVGDKEVIVFGHWSFYNKLHQSGREIREYAKYVSDKHGVTWILGHEHNPNKIIHEGVHLGYYLGCANPKVFGERQGNIMTLDKGGYGFKKYPFGEKFMKLKYTGKEELDDIEDPKNTYLKVYTDDTDKIPKIKEKYDDLNLNHFSIPLIKTLKEGEKIELESTSKNVDDYIIEAIEKNEYSPEDLLPVHNKIKEETL